MADIKYVIAGEDSGVTQTLKKIQAQSKRTGAQVAKDFENARKASAKSTEGIMSDAKKLQQRSIKLEVGTGDVSTGNTGHALNAENIKRNAAANEANARSVSKVSAAKVQEAIATSTVTAAQTAQMKSIQQLTIQMQSYQRIAQSSTDPTRIALYNKKVQDTQTEITKLGNVGKAGFDNMGNAIQKNTGGLTQMWTGLKTIGNLLPGIGLAGLLAFGMEPVLKYIAGLGLFEKKINEVIEAKKALNNVTLTGNQSAQGELAALRINMKVVQDANAPLKTRRDIYQQMQKEYPAYFKNISFEQAQAGKTGGAYDKLTKSIMATARAKAYMDKITENASKILANDEKDKELQEEILSLKSKQATVDKRAIDQIRTSNREGAGLKGVVESDKLQGEINNKMKERVTLVKDTNKLTLQSIDLERKATAEQGRGVTPLEDPEKPKSMDARLSREKALMNEITKVRMDASRKQLEGQAAELQNISDQYDLITKKVQYFFLDPKNKGTKLSSGQIISDLLKAENQERAAINKKYDDEAKKRRDEEGAAEAERFRDLLEEYQTYAQERLQIISDSNTAADELIKNGYDEQAKIAIDAGKRQAEALDKQKAEELDTYKFLFENVGELSRKRTVEALEQFRAQALAAGLSVEAIDELIAKFNLLDGKEKGTTRSQELNQIVEELSRVATQFENLEGSIAGITATLLTSAKSYLQITKGLEDFNKPNAKPEAKIAAGVGIAGAALAVVNSVVGYFKGLKKAKEEARKAMADYHSAAVKGEQEYQALLRQRDLDMVKRGKNSYRAITAHLELLKKQSPEIQKAYDKVYAALQGQSSVEGVGFKHGTWLRKAKTWDILSSLAGSDYVKLEKLYTEGKLKDAAKSDFEALKLLKKELEDAGLSVSELQSQLKELLTGTSTSSLASSLSDLFENGKFAAQDFAWSFEEIMGNAIRNSFRLKVMEDALQPFYEEFASLFVSGTPTEDQISALRAKYQDLGASLGAQFKELENITGQSLNKQAEPSVSSGQLSGAIQGISQQSADLLAGQFGGFRIAQLETLAQIKLQTGFNAQCVEYSVRNLNVALKIEQNTFRTANNTDALADMKVSLSEINRKMINGAAMAANGIGG